jgi:hypothetical protein
MGRCSVLLEDSAECALLFIKCIDKPQTIKILIIATSVKALLHEDEILLKAGPDHPEDHYR